MFEWKNTHTENLLIDALRSLHAVVFEEDNTTLTKVDNNGTMKGRRIRHTYPTLIDRALSHSFFRPF